MATKTEKEIAYLQALEDGKLPDMDAVEKWLDDWDKEHTNK